VRILEGSTEPGGRLRLLARLPTRGAWQGAIDNLLRATARHAVEINCGQTARASTLDDDILVIATGAEWTTRGYSPYRPERLAIPGHDLPCVLDIATAIQIAQDDARALGGNVLIVDETGDYLPLGLAEHLANAGVTVEILTPRPFLGADVQRTLDLPHVMPRLKALGVRVTAQHFLEAIAADAVTVYDIWGGAAEVRRPVDHVVMAMTRLPRDALALELAAAGRAHHVIGDVVAPRKLEAVIYEAERLARAL